MPRFMRKLAILAKIETTYKTDSVPTGALNALLVSNVGINPLNANNVDRDLIKPYFGGSEQLVGTANKTVNFDVELSGSGAAGTAPAWGPLLRACGFAEVVTAATRVDYTPITDNMESVTIYYYQDGALHKLLGARGTFALKAGIGERPVFSFTFTGIDGGLAAAANPAVTLTGFKTPLVVTDPNTADVTFGGAYAAGVVTGGTNYPSKGLELDCGNTVSYVPLLGGESVDVTQRAVTGSVALDLTAAQEVTFMNDVKAATLQTVSLQHGVTAGNIILLFLTGVQKIEPNYQDESGRSLNTYNLRAVPQAGNDEFRIVVM
ncbi:MAG: phage tail tube protein [Methylophilaceae bacterium]|nr:phage tail tube protein [Methyloradius sp.]